MSYPKLNFLNILLQEIVGEWRSQLYEWARSGQLLSAASKALVVKEVPETLVNLNKQLIRGDWSVVPSIEFLSSTDIDDALGAWSSQTQTIYINSDWIATASHESIREVLTEEFGHYLDSIVNKKDPLGDEGQIFRR